MKKLLKNTLTLFVAGALAFSLASCGGDDTGKPNSSTDKETESNYEDNPVKVDEEKSQLYISNFDGGVGTDWLYAARDRFEELYKDESFEPGKKGVQIFIERHKNSGVSTAEKMEGENYEIYFLENSNYLDMATSGKLYDITSAVTGKLSEYGEDKSIEEKLDDEYKNYFRLASGKYYGLPHYKSTYNLTYDIDLFDEYALFYGKDGKLGQTSDSDDLSNGPDGKAGTYDDGLPATYDEFFVLCQELKKSGCDPVIWSGQYDFYTAYFQAALKADFEGKETALNYNFNGQSTKLVDSISSDGTITYKGATQITRNNGYELYNSAGTYYALDFLYRIYNNGYYSDKSVDTNTSQYNAQSLYLLSSYATKTPIAMLIEGCWWTHEASSTFKQMTQRYEGSSLAERRLSLMPFPKATTAQIGEGQTVVDVSNSVACINGNISSEKAKLATTFLRFISTDESLLEFLRVTNMTRSYKFEISDEVYASLNTFTKSVVDIIKNAETVLPLDSSEFFQKHYAALGVSQPFILSSENEFPIARYKRGETALQRFGKLRNKYSQETWEALMLK